MARSQCVSVSTQLHYDPTGSSMYGGLPITDCDVTGNTRTMRSCLLSSSTPEMARIMRTEA